MCGKPSAIQQTEYVSGRGGAPVRFPYEFVTTSTITRRNLIFANHIGERIIAGIDIDLFCLALCKQRTRRRFVYHLSLRCGDPCFQAGEETTGGRCAPLRLTPMRFLCILAMLYWLRYTVQVRTGEREGTL